MYLLDTSLVTLLTLKRQAHIMLVSIFLEIKIQEIIMSMTGFSKLVLSVYFILFPAGTEW